MYNVQTPKKVDLMSKTMVPIKNKVCTQEQNYPPDESGGYFKNSEMRVEVVVKKVEWNSDEDIQGPFRNANIEVTDYPGKVKKLFTLTAGNPVFHQHEKAEKRDC